MLLVPWAPVLFADVGDYKGTINLSDRVEVRARETEGDPSSPAFDLVETATARIGLDSRRWAHFVSYTPSFTAPSILQSGWTSNTLLLHAGSVGTAWHDRFVRIAVTEDANYGTQNVVLLSTVAPGADGKAPPAQVSGTPQLVSFMFSRTSLLTTSVLDRKTTLSLLASYIVQGGLEEADRKVFPLQRGPRLELTLSHQITRIDYLDTDVAVQTSGSHPDFCPQSVTSLHPGDATVFAPDACDPAAQVGYATQGWRHRITHALSTTIAAGVGGLRARELTRESYQSLITPIGTASLIYETGLAPQLRTLRLDATLTPIVDVRTGSSDYRAQLVGTATFPEGNTTVTSRVWAMQSVETLETPPITLMRGEIELQERATRWFTYGLGLRAEWQHQPGLGSFASGVVYGVLGFAVPTTRF